jgi:ribonuclease Z
MSRISRRDALKLSGATLAAMAAGNGAQAAWNGLQPPPGLTQVNTTFKSLRPFDPAEPIGSREMRISFLGTSVIERRAQARSSVFVELGNGEAFVFDCGSGVVSNYVAMNIPWSKMNKIFLTHLHGDHTSDLTHIYCFGPQGDRKSPLFIWGPSRSDVKNPDYPANPRKQRYNPEYYEDGTLTFCERFREMNRWHTESQSFVGTEWDADEIKTKGIPGWPGVGFQASLGDGYDIYATELDWATGDAGEYWCTNTMLVPREVTPKPGQIRVPFGTGPGIAYETTEVRISFFPSVHGRNGSLGYKLEWLTEGLSMIFTGDTKPNDFLLTSAKAGGRPVDVLISEIVVDPEIWVARQSGITDPCDPTFQSGLLNAEAVQENSHTPQKAFGYIMKELQADQCAPRLAVGTHFQATDDTISMAMDDIRDWYSGPVLIASDLTVLKVTQSAIEACRAVVSDYSWSAKWDRPRKAALPKYYDTGSDNPYKPMAPLAQFDQELLDGVLDPCMYDPSGWQCAGNVPCPPAGTKRLR